ncbi:hypothetical protein [Neomegalonema sp.]|uniref:hypothetical protein n=1 Tax=Neomegalonema sp. TaxID=2039713 RepID=UPI00263619C7|nr:hypothetical protein [Neomegalonema sp.]MDD2867308.1 hypothetical protein [Neomegalonema sp.]
MVRRAVLFLALFVSAARAEEGLGEKTLSFVPHPTSSSIIQGEMVLATLRGVYDRKIALEKMTLSPSADFDWIQLGPDVWREERVEGRSFLTFERPLAIFPKHGGLSNFGPAEHDLTIITAAGDRQPMKVRAQPLTLSVSPMPEEPIDSPHGMHGLTPYERETAWRFASSRVEAEESFSADPSALKDGETVTRTVTLRAWGVLPEMLPPRPAIDEEWLITFTTPTERRLERTPEGPISTVVWRWSFRPETGEPGVIKAIPIPFFNTLTREMDRIEIPAMPIGYASFASSQIQGGETSPASRRGTVLALLLGMGGGLALLARSYAPEQAGALGAAWTRLRRRLAPGPLLRLRAAARGGDLLALRGAAEAWLSAREARSPARLARLESLDRAIYGGGAENFDAAAFLKGFLRGR